MVTFGIKSTILAKLLANTPKTVSNISACSILPPTGMIWTFLQNWAGKICAATKPRHEPVTSGLVSLNLKPATGVRL